MAVCRFVLLADHFFQIHAWQQINYSKIKMNYRCSKEPREAAAAEICSGLASSWCSLCKAEIHSFHNFELLFITSGKASAENSENDH